MPMLVEDAKVFLAGKSTGVQARLGKSMAEAAEKQDYELAAVYRDRLRALTYVQGSQTVHAEGLGDGDIFALACKAGQMCIQAFFIRGGQNWGHRSFFPAHTDDVPEDEVLAELPDAILRGSAAAAPDPARPRPARGRAGGRGAVASGRSARSRSTSRSAGARKKLIDQAKRNAEEALERRLAETTTQGKLLRELAETFELPEPPQRIEVYDNSHIMGTNATGAMIVAGPEGFRKNTYRKFNIKSAQTDDDFGMMQEVLERRFARLEKEDPDRKEGEWPDLLLIDGGKGQLTAVMEIMEEQGCSDIPVVGVAKGPHHGREGREVFHLPGGREMTLPVNSPLLFFLQRLRDEAHRFAIGTHRAKRAKSLTVSTLDEVPGIGPNRKRALLMHFGTARAVKGAALDDLERAPGIIEGDGARRSTIISTRGAE